MKKKMDRKGFTLVELLAVIIVLALIMVLAIPNVLSSANTAQKKTFQMYGEKVLNSAMTLYESQKLLNDVTKKTMTIGTKKYPCYTLSDLGYGEGTGYTGVVYVIPSTLIGSTGTNATTYHIYLTDETFGYESVEMSVVMNDISAVDTLESTDDIAKLKNTMASCK